MRWQFARRSASTRRTPISAQARRLASGNASPAPTAVRNGTVLPSGPLAYGLPADISTMIAFSSGDGGAAPSADLFADPELEQQLPLGRRELFQTRLVRGELGIVGDGRGLRRHSRALVCAGTKPVPDSTPRRGDRRRVRPRLRDGRILEMGGNQGHRCEPSHLGGSLRRNAYAGEWPSDYQRIRLGRLDGLPNGDDLGLDHSSARVLGCVGHQRQEPDALQRHH